MLVAHQDGNRIEAAHATKGNEYRCPGCKMVVVLKKGKIRIHHFAHKKNDDCFITKSETWAHYRAKILVRDSLRRRGIRAEIEWIVDCLPEDRRADVMAWSLNGNMYAIEIQQSSISVEEIILRTESYFRVGIAVAWVIVGGEQAFNNHEAMKLAKSIWIQRYSAPYWQQWIHDFNKDHLWMLNPVEGSFWCGKFDNCTTWIESTKWGGGYDKTLKRIKELTLEGPFSPDDLLIDSFYRKRSTYKHYHVPAGKVATLTPRQSVGV